MVDFTTLAIDLGSTFGYALGDSKGVIQKSGEVSLSAKDSNPGRRWLRFTEWLYDYRNVNEILYEEVQGFRSNDASMVYGALRSHLQVFCLVHGIRMGSLTPGQIKSDFTGNGNAKKEMMCDVAINLGWKNGVRGTREFNNECDAVALYWVAYSRRGIQPSFIKTVDNGSVILADADPRYLSVRGADIHSHCIAIQPHGVNPLTLIADPYFPCVYWLAVMAIQGRGRPTPHTSAKTQQRDMFKKTNFLYTLILCIYYLNISLNDLAPS